MKVVIVQNVDGAGFDRVGFSIRLVDDFASAVDTVHGLEMIAILKQDIGAGVYDRIQESKSHSILFDEQSPALAVAPIDITFRADDLG
jgi:hypothetical protein